MRRVVYERGLLGRVTATFTRRNLNIESLTVSESELPGVHRFTIVVQATREQARKLVTQLERQIDVLKAFVHEETQVLRRDLALYKVEAPYADASFDVLLMRHGARVIARDPEFVVVEHTGSQEETSALLRGLRSYGVLEFVRSGRVALTRPMRPLESFLDELEREGRIAC